MAVRSREPLSRHTKTAFTALALFVAMVLLVLLVPVDFVRRSPGAAVDLLGGAEGRPVVSFSDPLQQTFPSDGQFYLTTVDQTSVDDHLSLFQAILHHLLPTHEVLERSDVYQPGATAEGIAQRDREQMLNAQTRAIVAALRRKQYDEAREAPEKNWYVHEIVKVGDIQAGGPSDGKLEQGDALVAIEGQKVYSVAQVIREVRQGHEVGTDLRITYRRGSSEKAETITLGRYLDLDVPTMGVTWVQGYDYSGFFEAVSFDLDPAIGGEAGGLALALALYDRLTAGDLTGGRAIAAAGILELSELEFRVVPGGEAEPRIPEDIAAVGDVVGVRQRIVAAEEAGADLFVVPRGNCADLVGFETGVEITPVETFAEAVDRLQTLALEGAAAVVPHC
jgi:PDZ domain-containing protein